MASMSLAEAQARLRVLVAKAEEATTMIVGSAGRLEEIANGLAMLAGSGIAPDRMPSTRALAAETKRVQEEQRSRILQLAQGIREMIG